MPKTVTKPLAELPAVAPEHFRVPDPERLAHPVRATHPPRIYVVYIDSFGAANFTGNKFLTGIAEVSQVYFGVLLHAEGYAESAFL